MPTRRRSEPRSRVVARHQARIERAVHVDAPRIWRATRRLHARWLRIMLAAARRPYEALVIEQRAIHDYDAEVEALLAQIAGAAPPLDTSELLTQPEVQAATAHLASQSAFHAGFLRDDPRVGTLVRESERILRDDLSAYWQTLSDPRLLAERLVRQKVEGTPYVEASRQISREYGAEFYRAERLVRSSYNSASNNANLTVITDAGFAKSAWLTARDARVRRPTPSSPFDHRHADGQIARIGEPFLVSGERLRYPGDRSLGASAGNIINCRCTLIGVDA